MSKYQVFLEDGNNLVRSADNFYVDEQNNLLLTKYDQELEEGIIAIFRNWNHILELEEGRKRIIEENEQLDKCS